MGVLSNAIQTNPVGYASMGLGLIGSIFGASQQIKEQKNLIDNMMKVIENNRNQQVSMAMPYYQAGLQGLQQTKNFTNQMNVERFKENEYVNQARRNSLAEASRQVAQSQKSANYAFGNNQGRARGEKNRVARQGVSVKNNINLNWANQQNAERMKNTQLYLNGVSMLNQAGYTGTNMMSNAYNNYTQQATNILGQTPINTTMSDLSGNLMGFGMKDIVFKNYFDK